MHFKYFLYKRKGETFPPIFPVLIFCLKAAAFIHQSLFMKKSWWYTGEGMVCCSSKSIDYCAMNKYFTKANRILYENEKKKAEILFDVLCKFLLRDKIFFEKLIYTAKMYFGDNYFRNLYFHNAFFQSDFFRSSFIDSLNSFPEILYLICK